MAPTHIVGVWALATALLLTADAANAAVLCAKQRSDGTFSSSVKIREACRAREVQLAPQDVGFCCSAPTTSTTVTTSTSTTSSTMAVCGVPDGTGFCGGPCPSGQTCAAIDATTCGCTNALCSVTSPDGVCGGLCPRFTDTCISLGLGHCACETRCGFPDGFSCPNDPACPPGLTCNPGIGPAWPCVCN